MRSAVLITSVATFLGLAVVGWAWGMMTDFLEAPSGAGGAPRVVVIPKDADVETAVAVLRENGLAPKSRLLDWYVRYLHDRGTIQPGEYAVSPTMTPVQQIELLESGNVVTYTISVEPGMTAREIVARLGEKGLGDEAELLGLIADRTFVTSLGIEGRSLEGYLYPDIYDLPRGLGGEALLERFVRRFREATKQVDFERARRRGRSEYDVVTLASLIQTADVPEKEWRFYSALLDTRLDERVALAHRAANAYGAVQLPSDATAEEIRSSDWNTTARPGLPLTPIASPGLSALAAAANPASRRILYMAPRDDGTHVFCPDLDCYMEAFKKWKGRFPSALPRQFP